MRALGKDLTTVDDRIRQTPHSSKSPGLRMDKWHRDYVDINARNFHLISS